MNANEVMYHPMVYNITLNDDLKELVSQHIEQEYLFDGGKASLPFENGVLGYAENPAHGIQPDSFRSSIEHINDEFDGRSYSRQERVLVGEKQFMQDSHCMIGLCL